MLSCYSRLWAPRRISFLNNSSGNGWKCNIELNWVMWTREKDVFPRRPARLCQYFKSSFWVKVFTSPRNGFSCFLPRPPREKCKKAKVWARRMTVSLLHDSFFDRKKMMSSCINPSEGEVRNSYQPYQNTFGLKGVGKEVGSGIAGTFHVWDMILCLNENWVNYLHHDAGQFA